MSRFNIRDFKLGINTDNLKALKAIFDFLFFLTFVKTTTVDGEVRPLPLDWPYVKKTAQMLVARRRLVILKARQILCSWLIVAYSIWRCLKHENLTILIISQGKLDAQEMVRRAYFIYDNLPPFLQNLLPLKEGPRNMQNIEFANQSRILSLPSKADASRGKSPQIVFIDEAAYCRELDGMLAAVEPQLGPNSQLFIVSTPSPKLIGRSFTNLCKTADKRGYHRLDLHFKLCPVYRDPEWERAKRASMSQQKFAHEFELSLAGAGEAMILPGFGERHILEGGFIATEHHKLYRAIDPGPKMACIWFAEDPLGNITVYREAYFHGGSYSQRAKRILAMSGEEIYEWTVIDSADPQAKTDLAKYGVFSRLCLRKDVYETIDILNALLEGDGLDRPMLFISDQCPKLIEQIREWIGDDCGYPVKGQYDHGIDALRYGVHIVSKFRHRQRHGGFSTPQYENEPDEIDRNMDLGMGVGTLSLGDNEDRDFDERAFDLY